MSVQPPSGWAGMGPNMARNISREMSAFVNALLWVDGRGVTVDFNFLEDQDALVLRFSSPQPDGSAHTAAHVLTAEILNLSTGVNTLKARLFEAVQTRLGDLERAGAIAPKVNSHRPTLLTPPQELAYRLKHGHPRLANHPCRGQLLPTELVRTHDGHPTHLDAYSGTLLMLDPHALPHAQPGLILGYCGPVRHSDGTLGRVRGAVTLTARTSNRFTVLYTP